MNKITINNLSVKTHIGVTERERRKSQSLLLSIDMVPAIVYTEESDSLDDTIDYSSVRKGIKSIVQESSYHLIETVALVCARYIKKSFPVKSVTVTVKKYPYRDTEYVACSITA